MMKGDTYTVPEHLRLLGEEAQRLQQRVLDELDVWPSVEPSSDESLRELTLALLRRMSTTLEQVAGVLNGPWNEAANDGDVAAVYRATGRMEQLLDQLLAIHGQAQAIEERPSESYPKSLLCDAISDVMQQIGGFFGQLAEVIDDPAAFVSQAEIYGDHTMVVPLNMALNAPSELQELENYWQLLAPDAGHDAPSRCGGVDLLSLSIGVLLGCSLFGGGDQERGR